MSWSLCRKKICDTFSVIANGECCFVCLKASPFHLGNIVFFSNSVVEYICKSLVYSIGVLVKCYNNNNLFVYTKVIIRQTKQKPIVALNHTLQSYFAYHMCV